MSVEEEIKSWFAETLDSVNATLVEHRTALYQLRDAMEQDSYADELQLHDLMDARMVLDGSCAALRDTFSRLTAAHDLTNPDSVFGSAVAGSMRAAPHIADTIRYVQAAQESLKRVNVRVRAMAVLFTSETTWAGLVGGEFN